MCSLLVWLINKLQYKTYLYFLVYFVEKLCVSELFSSFCFKISKCNSDMKIEKINSVTALSTNKLLSNNSKMFQTLLLNVP